MAIRIASMGLALALHVFLARLLGASEYGHYSYAAAWLAFLQVISAVGMPDASIRYVSSYRTQGRWDLLRAHRPSDATRLSRGRRRRDRGFRKRDFTRVNPGR